MLNQMKGQGRLRCKRTFDKIEVDVRFHQLLFIQIVLKTKFYLIQKDKSREIPPEEIAPQFFINYLTKNQSL